MLSVYLIALTAVSYSSIAVQPSKLNMNFINNEIIKLKGLKDNERCHHFQSIMVTGGCVD